MHSSVCSYIELILSTVLQPCDATQRLEFLIDDTAYSVFSTSESSKLVQLIQLLV